jgi:hypothetical protein
MKRYCDSRNQIAVLTNPRWGWWLKHQDWNLVFDSTLVELILSGQKQQIKNLLPEWKHLVDELEIEWLQAGTLFRIEDYRGTEMVTVLVRGTAPVTGSNLDTDQQWIKA